MRPAHALCLYILFVFAGAAILAPWVHFALEALGFTVILFRRVVARCLLILALLGLWPLIRALGIRGFSEIGWRRYPKMGRDLATGLAIGSLLLLLASGISIAVGAFELTPAHPPARWLKQILSALTTAIVVSVLEETLFRGAIYTALQRTWNTVAALWTSSAIYGIVHFLTKAESPANIDWSSGFLVLGRMLRDFTDWQLVIPGFLSLTLLGVIFVKALQQTNALFMSMGIHAALIFWVKLFGFATDPAPNANRWFWGTEKLTDGWFCFTLLAVTAIFFSRKKAAA